MILVTGGTGMIGAHTALALVEAGRDVLVTTHSRPGVPSFLDGKVSVERLDVTDRDALLELGKRHEITDIIHLAGSVPSADDPVRFFRTDTVGLLNALDAARAWKVRRFAVASSLGVYAGRAEIPWPEALDLPTVALPHVIVAFKKSAETLTTHALQGTGTQPVLLRIGTIWGPLVDPESPFFHLPSYLSAVLRGEQPPALVADDGGDICYAPDAGRAIAGLLTTDTLRHDVYNVSSGRPFTNRDVVETIRALRPGVTLQLVEGSEPGNGSRPYLDINRLTEDTGFTPRYDLRSAISDYFDWRKDNSR